MTRPYHRRLKPTDAILSMLEGLGNIGATHDEVCAAMQITKPTLYLFFEKYPKARDAFENGMWRGKISLRRAQMQAALKGNIIMQIFLGKNMLGQRDKWDIETNMQHSISVELQQILKVIDGTQRSLPTDFERLSPEDSQSGNNSNGHAGNGHAEEAEIVPDSGPHKLFN